MDKRLNKAFKTIDNLSSTDLLAEKILFRINKRQEKRAQIRSVISRVVSCFSALASVPFFIQAINHLQSNGFWNYLSLLFSDTSSMLVYWREFFLSLLEALPLFEVISLLALIFILFVSLKYSFKNYKQVGLSANLA